MNNALTNVTLEHAQTNQSQSQYYFTTGGLPPIISSWPQAPRGSRPFFAIEPLNTENTFL
jgi:hypothetical protein